MNFQLFYLKNLYLFKDKQLQNYKNIINDKKICNELKQYANKYCFIFSIKVLNNIFFIEK